MDWEQSQKGNLSNAEIGGQLFIAYNHLVKSGKEVPLTTKAAKDVLGAFENIFGHLLDEQPSVAVENDGKISPKPLSVGQLLELRHNQDLIEQAI